MALIKVRHFLAQILQIIFISCLSISCLFISTVQAAERMSFSRYALNSGDQIAVSVFGEDDMRVETRLTDAGTISYPFLGEVRVKGMTVGQLQKYLNNCVKG